MKLLLLCLGLTLVCAQEEENNNAVTSNFDLSKISGEWYSVLIASDRREEIEEDGNMRVFVEHIGYQGESSLTFKLHEISMSPGPRWGSSLSLQCECFVTWTPISSLPGPHVLL
ncbi:allergen Fel d 4-like [Cebus imitator]|uniref:allergen Fel d 4-like n=1 Tax=Cebus imitator TaxID=2715852 RepID=UPI00189AE2D0|nr:allergen Fel d 4-like [Cebus imitator]